MNIDLCICTFQRPHVAATLQSLAALTLAAGWQVSVIVADNDDTPSARELVEGMATSYPHALKYIHAPARNISTARNACLDAADGDLLAFIDDDELATHGWLVALVAMQAATGAAAVLGPVRSRYPAGSAAWLLRGDFHSIKPVWVKGEIITGYTSNVLLTRTAPPLQGLRFDPRLGRSGGEDTAFFAALYKAGGIIAYAPDAVVTENVAPSRLSFRWLLRRVYRSGQTHGMMLAENGSSRLKNLVKAGAKAAWCFGMALLTLPVGRARYWALRGALHCGVVARLLGQAELVQYG